MKTAIISLLLIFFFTTFFVNNGHAQCLNQVEHTLGTAVVNGIDVTVNQFGYVDTFLTYCPQVTKPYFIGYDWSLGSGNGTYSFQFDPPVDSLTLNFSGISYQNGHQEIVIVEINGAHYPIPQIGSDNNCDPVAVLTANGNITGCDNCSVSGWVGTNISGPIHSLSVKDSVAIGLPAGALFSLFICNAGLTNTFENEITELDIYPNPVRQTLYVDSNNLSNANFTLHDLHGRAILTNTVIGSSKATLDMSGLATGVYFLSMNRNGQLLTRKLIVQ